MLDLKDTADQARCLELASGADVFVEGYRPGVADRLGVGYEAVRNGNQKIVYCSLSGYGAVGDLAEVPGHDVNYRAYTGALPHDAVSPAADEFPGRGHAAADGGGRARRTRPHPRRDDGTRRLSGSAG